MKPISIPGLVLTATLASSALADTDTQVIGDFSQYEQIPQAPWQLVRFDEEIPATQYRLRRHEGVSAVEASADASMALLARPLDADLQRTPVLCWRWWVDEPIEQADMTKKSGDDYAARMYVTFDLPSSAMSLGTRLKLGAARTLHGSDLPDAAINYVWDNKHAIGTTRDNAYTDRAQMMVLRTGLNDTGRWVEERRNLLADLKQLFGTDSATTLQLAVASDSDNTGAKTSALFADIHMVGKDAQCRFQPTGTGH